MFHELQANGDYTGDAIDKEVGHRSVLLAPDSYTGDCTNWVRYGPT